MWVDRAAWSPLCLLLLTGMLLPAAVGADQISLPAPSSSAWQPLVFPRVERHTQYTDAAPAGALRARSECAASARVLSLEGVNLAEFPRLHWRWQIVEPLRAEADERTKSGDDFAARVYVAFRFDHDRASLLERARHRLGAALYGAALPGSALTYVWSRAAPAGTSWENPYAATSRMISLGMGPQPDWRSEEVDLIADYTRWFGGPMPPALFVAVMTDSDDTCKSAEALYADFALRAAPPRDP
jgi:Protein of unknown function (DUF3047)